jgi:SAM-dependent methyltransferase
VKAEAGRLPFPAAAFDLALALDLLEQRGVAPAQTLVEIRRVLRPGGRLLVRVPAHPWLLGPHDAFCGGARRYRRAELVALIVGADFTILRLTYANGLPFAWPRGPVCLAARICGPCRSNSTGFCSVFSAQRRVGCGITICRWGCR